MKSRHYPWCRQILRHNVRLHLLSEKSPYVAPLAVVPQLISAIRTTPPYGRGRQVLQIAQGLLQISIGFEWKIARALMAFIVVWESICKPCLASSSTGLCAQGAP
eukprot:1015086-Amphidinium_carterae.1